MSHELIIDNFAGGGGASTGIEAALGRPVDIAINHDPVAIAMHRVNHPHTNHLNEDVWRVDSAEVCGDRPVGLAWFSPDCTHFSKAKGGKPVKKKIRGLAWVVLRWAAKVKPRVIMLENVEEFVTWGPLVRKDDGSHYPCPKRKGQTFKTFINALRKHGYEVEYKALRACDYGAPTIRKRLFLIARCDGQLIVWPDPTHGDPKSEAVKSGRLKPWRTAAGCIDWSIPCPSIFERKRPLAEATLRRIAKGIMKYVLNNPEPFIVTYYGDKGGEFRGQDIDEPLRTQTTENRHALVTPFLSSSAYSKTTGRGEYIYPPKEPVRTITGTNDKILITPSLVGVGGRAGQSRPRSGNEPAATITSKADVALVSAFLAQHNGGFNRTPVRSAEGPLSTIVSGGSQQQIVTVNLIRNMGQSVGSDLNESGRTVTMKEKDSLVTSHIVKLKGTNIGQDAREPLHTVTAGGFHFGEVRAFLMKYYGNEKDGVELNEPMHTVTSKDRFGLVTVHGEEYRIADIGMRMLAPRELFRAQGFPDTYIIDRDADGKPFTKTAQVAKCGNSVCPDMAEALVRANVRIEKMAKKTERSRHTDYGKEAAL